MIECLRMSRLLIESDAYFSVAMRPCRSSRIGAGCDMDVRLDRVRSFPPHN